MESGVWRSGVGEWECGEAQGMSSGMSPELSMESGTGRDSNPAIFVGCSKPSSKVDDGVNDRDDIKTHVMVEDIKIVVSKHP